MFISTYRNKLDKKLRVSVPSQFRSVVAQSNFAGVVVYKSIINDCIEGCTIERMQKMMDMIDNLDPFSNERDAFATAILGGSFQLSFDGEGRIIIPEELIDSLSGTEQAVFVGKGSTFEIWSEIEFAKYSENARKIAFENRGKMVKI